MQAAMICDCLLSVPRSSRAVAFSPKLKAAVQLSPTTEASEERFSVIESRQEITSNTTKAAPPSRRAAQDVAIMINVCFCRIESFLSINADCLDLPPIAAQMADSAERRFPRGKVGFSFPVTIY